MDIKHSHPYAKQLVMHEPALSPYNLYASLLSVHDYTGGYGLKLGCAP